jgi:hypothetical protein
MGILRQLVTGPKGEVDEQAMISIVTAGVILGLSVYSVVWMRQQFDPLALGSGVGALVGGSSAGFGLRSMWSAPALPVPPGGGYDNPG